MYILSVFTFEDLLFECWTLHFWQVLLINFRLFVADFATDFCKKTPKHSELWFQQIEQRE